MLVEETHAVCREEAEWLVSSVPHWHHRFEIYPGVCTPGTYEPAIVLNLIDLPPDLSGKTVLDVGVSDGFFARELHLRGAAVTCVDYRAKSAHGFHVMEKLLGFEFPYHQANVLELDPVKLGTFDYVLFLGVLYHLPDMMAGLVKMRRLCHEAMFLESYTEEFGVEMPLARYFAGATLGEDLTNFWAPNEQCLRAMLHDAGFDVAQECNDSKRYIAKCIPSSDRERLTKVGLAYGLVPSSPA